MLSERPGWEGVARVPQNDEGCVVKINYPSEFVELMDLFRAALLMREFSARVLELTKDIVEENAGNYTVWQYRRDCLAALNCNLNEELDYLDGFADDNPKNYQIWYHRRVIVERLQNPSREIAFCNNVLDQDAKNYHAWAHRQWVFKTFGSRSENSHWWTEELAYLDRLILLDVRNNSAWNQRWFIVHTRPDSASSAELQAEVEYALLHIGKVKFNESSWNYLRGLQTKHLNDIALQDLILSRCTALVADLSYAECPYLLAFIADIRVLSASSALWKKQNGEVVELTDELITGLQQSCAYYTKLTEIDKLRVKYWTKRLGEAKLSLEFLVK